MGKRKLTRFFLVSVGIIFGLLLVSSVCYAQIPQMINYQGYLTDSEGYPLDGTVDMVFALYDVDTGGSPLWSETQTGVDVTDGLFSINLGAVTPITLSFDTPYWLGVKVGTDSEMTPRQPITSVGYAYRAGIADAVTAGGVESYMLADDAVTGDKIDDGAIGSVHLGLGAVTTNKLHNNAVTSAKILNNSVTADDIADGPGSLLDADTLDGYNSGDFILSGADNWVNETGDSMTGKLDISVASGDGLSSTTTSTVINTSAIYGHATATSVATNGIHGQTDSTSGRGVLGYASSSSGTNYGLYGRSNSTSGRGVYGYATAYSGENYGVYGHSVSTSGRGVYGEASASTGSTCGVWGQNSSTSGCGVRGYATASTGTTYGVWGESDSTSGYGIYGNATASSGTNYGVYGNSYSTHGRGVYGNATASTGLNYGVWGESASTNGRGVCGYATASSGYNYGVVGASDSTSGCGVYGYASASSGGTYGIQGETDSISGRGVYGRADASSGDTYGVYGLSYSTSGRGVYGRAAANSGPTFGVQGESNSPNGVGIDGYASASSGTNYGVIGRSNSPSGRGVLGYNTATTGNTSGVFGRSYSTSGYGIFGDAAANSGTNYGVFGQSNSIDGCGVYGEGPKRGVIGSTVGSDGVTFAIVGRNYNNPDGIGVIGTAHANSGNATGVYGQTMSPEGWDFYAANDDYGPFTGAHEAKLSEDFPQEVEPGLIVAATGQAQIRYRIDGSVNLSSTLPTVKLADTPHDKAVFGVLVAETTLHLDHWYEASEGERFAKVNALGEGRVWVADINGAIEAGDYITTSVIPGYGQKQNDDLLHSYTLGKAIETIDWDTVTEMVEIDGTTYKVYLIAVVYTSG